MSDRVTITVRDHVADVRLNRPDKLNALDPAQIDAIVDAGERLAAMEGVRAVVLSGEGRGFCAGMDMATFAAAAEGTGSLGAPLVERTHGNANLFQHIVLLWRRLPMPVIAAVHGPCIGGGLQIASSADVRIVAPDATMSIMEMRWGLVPDMGSFTTWRGFVRDDVLRELTYTNRSITGEEALRLGFATHVDPDPRARALELGAEIASRNPDAVRAVKRLVNALPDLDEDQILLRESQEQDAVAGTPNQIEAVTAFLQQRAPVFED